MSKIFEWTAEDMVNAGRVKSDDLKILKKWVKKQDDMLNYSDEHLVIFLLSCDNQQELTRRTIKENVKALKDYPPLFTERDVERPELWDQIESLEWSAFPTRTDDNYVVIFERLSNFSFWKYSLEYSAKLLLMTGASTIYKNPPKGIIMLFDMEGASLMHLTRLRYGMLKIFFHYIQEAMPLKLKAVHVLNTKYFIDKLLLCLKPFIRTELMDKIKFHPSNMNMDEFYENHIPKKCIPKDYGGDLPPVSELHAQNTKTLKELKDTFKAEEEFWGFS